MFEASEKERREHLVEARSCEAVPGVNYLSHNKNSMENRAPHEDGVSSETD